MNESPKSYHRVSLSGKSAELFVKLKAKFLETVEKVLELEADSRTDSTIRDELKNGKNLLLDYGKARLIRAKVENEEIQARIEKSFAEQKEILARARLTEEQANIKRTERQMLDYLWKIKQTRYSLMTMQSLVLAEPHEEAIIYGNSIENLLSVLKAIQEDLEISLNDLSTS